MLCASFLDFDCLSTARTVRLFLASLGEGQEYERRENHHRADHGPWAGNLADGKEGPHRVHDWLGQDE